MKKIIFLLLFSVGTSGLIQAQKIKFKNNKVLVDKVECLSYDSSDPNNVVISTLDDSQTIFLKFIRPGIGRNGGLFTKIIFVEQEKSFTSKSFIFSKSLLVKKLINDKVIKDCAFDESKIDKFITRYDENIEDTLIRF